MAPPAHAEPKTRPHPVSPAADVARRSLSRVLAVTGAIGLALVWAYWTCVVGLWKDWQNDPNYSVGQLVPLAAIGLVWAQRHALRACRLAPCWWAGLLVLLVAQVLRLLGLILFYESIERYALVLTVAGLVLLVAGWQVFARLRWILLLLMLMVPLPGRIHNALAGPLQQYATNSTVFVLEVFGAEAVNEGNILVLGDETSIGIAEACSGLRMLTAFVVVAAVLAFLIDRPPWQRAVLVLSSVPIAIACNVVRLVATVALYVNTSSTLAERFFHDFAGVTMMPLAIGMLLVELWLMKALFVPEAQRAETAS